MKEKYVHLATAVGLAASMLIALPVLAETSVGVNVQGGIHNGANGGVQIHAGMRPGMAPGIFGTVTAVNGSTLTVSAMARPYATSTASGTTTAYTVDASNAKIYKGSATSTVSVSSIATGDKVMVQGTVNGTSVTATTIRDGLMGPMMGGGPGMWGGKGGPGHSSSTPPVSPIQGNGEPVVGGSITAISGDTLTVTNTGNATYTIDVTNATIVKNGTTTTVSSLATGDNVVVQGTVNGTSVAATSVLDQGAKPTNSSSTSGAGPKGGFGGFFGAIGGFFAHLFGF